MKNSKRDAYLFHPLDMVEHFSQREGWEFYRATNEELVLAIEGRVRYHGIQIVWFSRIQTLELQNDMNMEPPSNRLNEFYNLVNQINRLSFHGKFTFAEDDLCLTYQTHLLLAQDKLPSQSQILMLVNSALTVVDNFYPAFVDIATTKENVREIMQRYKHKRPFNNY